MHKSLKLLITSISVLLFIGLILGFLKAVGGNYLANASFITIGMILIALSFGTYYLFKGLRKLWTLVAIFGIILMQSCNYAKSNQQVLVSDDCGMTWKKINAGDAVPKGTMNPCYMKVVIPNFPMQGESRFISNLEKTVRVAVHIDYDYSITEPLAFIQQAKYLGKANSNVDSDAALDPSAFEGAENAVIDKRIREVSKAMFLNEDIVELDQADLEAKLQVESNKILEPLGVHLNFITLTFEPDEQTRQAIDVATAMKIYENRGLTELGKQVIAARAGATKVIVKNIVPQDNKETNE